MVERKVIELTRSQSHCHWQMLLATGSDDIRGRKSQKSWEVICEFNCGEMVGENQLCLCVYPLYRVFIKHYDLLSTRQEPGSCVVVDWQVYYYVKEQYQFVDIVSVFMSCHDIYFDISVRKQTLKLHKNNSDTI